MKHIRTLGRIAALIAFITLVTAAAVAQEMSTGRRLTLEECIAIGLERSIDVRRAQAGANQAASRLTAAFGAYLPSLDINANYNRQLTNLRPQFSIVNGVPITGQPLPNTYGLNSSMNLTLFNGFQREADFDAAKLTMNAASSDIRFNKGATRFTITRQYIELLRRKQILTSRRESRALAAATLERARALFDAGVGRSQDVTSQETELGNIDVALVQAENDVIAGRAQLLNAMNVDAMQEIDIDEKSVSPDVTEADIAAYRKKMGPESELSEITMSRRADLQSALERTKAADQTITSARSGYYPTITANGGYTWRNFVIADFDRQGQVFAGLFIRIPVFDQFVTQARVADAELNRAQNELETERVRNQIRTDLRNSFAQLELAERGVEISSRAIKFATNNADAARDRFNAGAATIIELQNANNQLITAQINRVTAVYAYHSAVASLEFATGMSGGK
ncbi:MAG: TolC family protein [Candidatus Kapabacteria bacterium]|nr:TolC family protein [Candidatus Kapabacteria bacterium]